MSSVLPRPRVVAALVVGRGAFRFAAYAAPRGGLGWLTALTLVPRPGAAALLGGRRGDS